MDKQTSSIQLIGMLLMAGLLTWYISTQKVDEEPKSQTTEENTVTNSGTDVNPQVAPNVELDSTQIAAKKASMGVFAAAAVGQEKEVVIENENLKLVFNSKGASLKSAQLKKYTDYNNFNASKDEPLELLNDENHSLNLQLETADNRIIQTKDLYFTPIKSENGIDFEANTDQGKLKISYHLDSLYQVSVSVVSKDLASSLRKSSLLWDLKSLHIEKGRSLESQNSEIYYNGNGEVDYDTGEEEGIDNFKWISYRQHLFTTILESKTDLNNVSFGFSRLDDTDTVHIAQYNSVMPLTTASQDINAHFDWFIGPNQYELLESYNDEYKQNVQFGWKIFRWVNMGVFYPIFKFLKGAGLPLGIIILLMTIVVKLLLSPVTYKQYLQSGMMRVLRPQMDEINEKYKDKDAMKKQQATMELYKKAGVNPMAGCLPALIQMPIVYAMFRFWPALIDIRQKGFLWADDLSAYDSIMDLPFEIPFYGAHVSLFTLLMAISMVFQFRLSGNQMSAPSQPGMPDMKFIMYLMPVMMLFFFNNYSSGLTLYYFIANATTILITWIVKTFVLNEEKIQAKMQAQQAKPKKTSKFQERLQKAMKEAQKQQGKK